MMRTEYTPRIVGTTFLHTLVIRDYFNTRPHRFVIRMIRSNRMQNLADLYHHGNDEIHVY